jgi:hypothetical protein
MHGEEGVRSVGGAETGSRKGEVCAVGDNESATSLGDRIRLVAAGSQEVTSIEPGCPRS